MVNESSGVRIEAWSEEDFDLLRAANAPEMTAHLSGPETEEQLLARHRRYVTLSAEDTARSRVYRIVAADTGERAGTIGFWESDWQGREIYETGWGVLPGFQGRGIASAAARAVIGAARAAGLHRCLHAFPRLSNTASNAVCRKAGFQLMGEHEIDYPPGSFHPSNDWRFDLWAPLPPAPPGP
ncbi:GNAT family N-acetyltransferase [Streptomyces sp. CAU 1734]|uniref:GNAT family N-acetyltransferase n=1 Tax=Streptomyces sp. CAU 1734 TaxID=3140360 RepID=UPI00326157D1